MRLSIALTCALAISNTALAKDAYLSIGGSVGVFRTDASIFNPSQTKDIQVQAYYLPVGNADNSSVQPISVTVPKRQMLVFNDVVTSLFHASNLGAIRFKSDDDFVATQRIYAQAESGTLGQFVPGLDVSTARKAGVLIQLKSNSAFRTNIGAVNPNAATANVTWKLYDKQNTLIGSGRNDVMPPFAVIGPQNVAGFLSAGSADLTDAWVSYTSDQPLFVYASVVDNATTDPTFIPAVEDIAAGIPKDAYLSIGGSVGVFRTDASVFNPSQTKDIQVQAYYLPVGNTDNSSVQPIAVTVPKRQMLVFNDVVTSLFHASNLGAIRFKSDDDFVATQRIYAQTASGTLGQFVPGLDLSTAKKAGVLIQLKSNSAFRTNIGAVNPNSVAANVTWKLYDKQNALIGSGRNDMMPPFAVLSPQNLAAYLNAGSADLTDAWVSYTSDQPLFVYASVVDNASTDPTFIPGSEDTGAEVQTPPPPTPQGKTFNVTEQSFVITISPQIKPEDLKVGDQVTFHITVRDSTHGFQLVDPDGRNAIPPAIFAPGDVVDKTFTVSKKGTYTYFCTNSACGTGHDSMVGSFVVGTPTEDPRPGY
jgi:plastocyanin